MLHSILKEPANTLTNLRDWGGGSFELAAPWVIDCLQGNAALLLLTSILDLL